MNVLRSLALLLTFFQSVPLQASLLSEYQGDTSPTSQGWQVMGNGTPLVSNGGIDPADETPYWEIEDGASSLFSFSNSANISYANTRGSAAGWTYTVRAKVIDCPTANYAVSIRLADDYHRWCVVLSDSGVYLDTISGLILLKNVNTKDQYRTYQIVYSGGASGNITVYVDGVAIGTYSSSQTPASWGSGYYVSFGSLTTHDSGKARWSQASLTTGQSPVKSTLFSYSANSGPTTQGWSIASNGLPIVSAAGVETYGRPYWKIQDGSGCLFSFSQTNALNYANTRGSSAGWTYTAKVRLIECASPNYAVSMNVADGVYLWTVVLSEEGIYAQYDGSLKLLSSWNTKKGYHTYQMVYSGGLAGRMSVYADGLLCGTFSASQVATPPGIGYYASFGSTSTVATGTAHWYQTRMETGQLPMSRSVVRFSPDSAPSYSLWDEDSNGTPVISQAGQEPDGTKYWEIEDGSSARFAYTTTTGLNHELTRGSTAGWTYSAKVKVLQSNQGSAISLRVADATFLWTVSITEDGIYAYYDGQMRLIASMDTTDRYHVVQMLYDPDLSGINQGMLHVYVDGVHCGGFSTSQTNSSSTYFATFGSIDTLGSGKARWASVDFQKGQHPSYSGLMPAWYDSVSLGSRTPEDIAQNGGSAVILYAASWPTGKALMRGYLNAAYDCGINVLLGAPANWSSNSEIIESFNDHPSVVGWYTADEPILAGVSAQDCLDTYEMIKSKSEKPVAICFSTACLTSPNFSLFENAYDIFGVDAYPYTSASTAEFDRIYAFNYFSDLAQAASLTNGKPFFMAVQAFGTCNLLGTTARLPTYREIRQMIHHAVHNGGQVALFADIVAELSNSQPASPYPYDGAQWKEDYAYLLAEDLGVVARSRVLTPGPAAASCVVNNANVRAKIFKDPSTGKNHLFVINDSASSLSNVRFDISNAGTITTARPLYSPAGDSVAPITIQGSSTKYFYDSLSTHDVHHYVLE